MFKFLLFFTLFLVTASPAHAVKLSELPSATTLGGTELIYMVQGGVTSKATPAQFLSYMETNIDSLVFLNAGLKALDTNASHALVFKPGSDLSAERTLVFNTGDSDRSFTLNGDFTASGTTSGTNTGDQTSVTGNAGSVTFADAGSDTTTWVALGTAATGNLGPATDAGLTYNASTNALSAGSLTLTADLAVTDGGTGASNKAGAQTNLGLRQEYCWAASDFNTTTITAATSLAIEYLPAALTVTGVRAYARTAPTGLMTIDINEAGTSILSTKLTIDSGEKTSGTAATAAVVSDSAIAANAEMTVDVDSTTGGKGLVVCLEGYY